MMGISIGKEKPLALGEPASSSATRSETIKSLPASCGASGSVMILTVKVPLSVFVELPSIDVTSTKPLVTVPKFVVLGFSEIFWNE